MCCCDPCCAIAASVYTIIQSIIHGAICLWLITVYVCYTSVVDGIHGLFTLWYYTYFYRDECIDTRISVILNDSIQIPPQVNRTVDELFELSSSAPEARITFNFLILFAVLDFVFIICAIVLLVGVFSKTAKFSRKYFYLPWLACCLAVCIAEAIVVSYYVKHLYETNTFEGWFNFIGGYNKTDYQIVDFITDLGTIQSILILPSVLTIFFIVRFGIFWLINIIFFISLLCTVCKKCEKRPKQHDFQPYSPPDMTNFIDTNSPYYETITNGDSSQNMIKVVDSTSPNYAKDTNTDAVIIKRRDNYLKKDVVETLTMKEKPLKAPSEMDSDTNEARIRRWQLYYGSDAYDLKVMTPRPSNASSKGTEELRKYSKGNYSLENKPGRPSARTYNKEELNPHPVQYNLVNRSNQSNVSNQRDSNSVHGDVRNQLPWSYFQKRDSTETPKPSTPEIMPPVPVPDYIIKFGRNREIREN